ncbi:MAG: histidinol dehydrogenase, partial [Myxococcales bacterium]|nr:histidinol dehydrogenase [Myxococcales bacterium]
MTACAGITNGAGWNWFSSHTARQTASARSGLRFSRFRTCSFDSTFLRPQQVIEYDRGALDEVRSAIVTLATAEALPAHGEAITAR